LLLAIAANLITSCEAATVSWDYLSGPKQASCICYSGSSWVPNNFDSAVLACANYALTADPTDYSSIAALESFCTKQGDVVGGGSAPKTTPAATTTAPTTAGSTSQTTTKASAVTTGPITACSSVDAAISSCEAATAGWIDLSGSQQASCICYSGTSWAPGNFDGAVLTCANYISTAVPTNYADISSLQNFCTKKGNVRASGTGSVVVVTGSPATPSVGSSSSAAKSSTSVAPTVVIVTATAPTASTSAPAKSSGSRNGFEGTMIYLGFSLALAALGMCIML
jgi:ribosomal protein S18